MIREFKELGEYALRDCSEENRKIEFLNALTIIPNENDIFDEKLKEKLKDKAYEIVFNLDTKKNIIEIKLGEEYSYDKRYLFFGFESPARLSKLYFTSNNWNYHLKTIPEMFNYINKEFNNKYEKFRNYLKEINDIFYKEIIVTEIDKKGKDKEKKIDYLNYENLNNAQKEIFLKYYNNKKNDTKNKTWSEFDFIKGSYEDFIINDILKINKKEYDLLQPNIFSLKINNKYIQEINEFKADYIEIVYYSIKERFFEKSLNVPCDICGAKNIKVTADINIPTKFYITDKPYFFENLSGSNAYKSFAICERCYEEIRIGISKIEEKFESKLFGNLNYYIIPKNIKNIQNFEAVIKKINDRLNNKKSTISDEIEEIKGTKKTERKIDNLSLDFLFWFKNKQEFSIIDNIADISFCRTIKILDELDTLNSSPFYDYLNFKTTINDLYYFLFPNKNSHGKLDKKIYRKEIVSLFSSILKERVIDYHFLITNFNFIFRKTFHNKESTINKDSLLFRPLKMNILFSWLNKITKLEGGFNKMDGKSLIEISDKDIKEYFEIHKDIYGNNFYRQGLFLLGKLVNSILKEQQEKSSNFMDKINFDGIPVHRIKNLIFQLTDYLKIYKILEFENQTYSQMMDRLQELENSKMNKDEVLFYILSGISFGRYLGNKYASIKENKIKQGGVK